jgi:glycosyltransferase involved in cell wall biosynthesis
LIRFLEDSSGDYDRILFVTYLYYPTAVGLPIVSDKAVLMPTAHNEFALRLGIYKPVFQKPRSIIFLSQEERDLVHELFGNQSIPHAVTGFGVEIQPHGEDTGDYFLYMGRVEVGKNCPEMFEFCSRSGIKMKVIGSTQLKNIPEYIEYLGFVSEDEKNSLLAGCKALVIPSRNESLSIVALEAWAQGKPVIAHAGSAVLRGHIDRSGGGYVYRDYQEFHHIVKNIDPKKGLLGREYVKENYSWESLLPEFISAFTH